jgi:hypothetical protein
MRYLTAAIAVVWIFVGSQTVADHKDVLHAFEKYIKSLSGCDVEAWKAMTTPDWLSVSADGVTDRSRGFQRPPDCKPVGPARVFDLRVRTYGPDAAVLVAGIQLPEGLGVQLSTSFWVRQNGQWLEASEHTSWFKQKEK